MLVLHDRTDDESDTEIEAVAESASSEDSQTPEKDEAVANLQYRHDYEFAVGHNVSALTHCDDQAHCTEVCTTWIPTATVPRVEPSKIPNVQLSMEALADADSAETIH